MAKSGRNKVNDKLLKPLQLDEQYESYLNISLPQPALPYKKPDICLEVVDSATTTVAAGTGNLFFPVVITLASYLQMKAFKMI